MPATDDLQAGAAVVLVLADPPSAAARLCVALRGHWRVVTSGPADLIVANSVAARATRPEIPAVLVGVTEITGIGDLVGEVHAIVRDAEAEIVPAVERALARVRARRRQVQGSLALRRMAVSASGGEHAGPRELLSLIATGTLPQIADYDIAALLVAPLTEPGAQGTGIIHLHCHRPSTSAALAGVRDRCVARFTVLASERDRPLDAERLVVDVSGEPMPTATVSPGRPHTVEVPLRATPDAPVEGLLQLVRFGAPVDHDAGLVAQLAELACQLVGHQSTRIADERRRLAHMLDSMADGVLLTDETNEILLINPAARRLLGLPATAEVTARYLKDRLGFYPYDLVAREHSAREELTVGDKTLHSIISPVHDAAGKRTGVVVVLRDLSEWKQLEQRKQEFVAVVSHELRTPLTAISGALDILLSAGLGDKQRRYAAMARDAAVRLHALMDDLLDAARFQGGSISMQLEPLALDELARSTLERFRGAALEKRIDLSFRIDRDADPAPGRGPIRILGDAERLSQVLGNLFSNAMKFTPEDGRVEVEVFGPGAAATHVGVSVWNTGSTIPEDSRERVFDKFEQAAATSTRRVGGSGLGLFISRSIVEGHGGRIWVERAPIGTKFVLTLPAAPGEHTGAQTVEAPLDPVTGDGRQVLVVDGDRNAAYLLKGALMAAGHRVHVSHDGDEALAWAREQRPDLVVVDARLSWETSQGTDPGAGFALLEILKHDPDTRKAALIGLAAPGDREGGRADAWFSKPVDLDAFRAASTRLLIEKARVAAIKLLIVDDDPDIRMICREVLERAGYVVREAPDGRSALAEARSYRPDLVLIDVMMPDLDGFQTAKQLRDQRDGTMMPIIFVSARGQTADKVRAFKLGAEDYLVKPFDSLELVARVEKALERRDRQIGASPTTRLPGARDIDLEVERRLSAGDKFAFVYVDLDNLKAFNDCYGIAKADGIIRQTGDLLRDVVAREGGPGDFIGHIAGDDFVFLTSLERVDQVGAQVCAAFDRLIPLYYNQRDRQRGYIEAYDRYGQLRRFPIMSVSVAALTIDGAPRLRDFAEVGTAAAEAKRRAKAIEGSAFVRDERVLYPAGSIARTPAAG